jgi:23S rRNA (uridine2552-2'-O)-methyltransferase
VTYERKDAHYKRARAEGYRARSVYKLAELDRRWRLLRHGDAVIDLGAWPGAWLQLARERVGAEGRVVGVDLAKIEKLPRRTSPSWSATSATRRRPMRSSSGSAGRPTSSSPIWRRS